MRVIYEPTGRAKEYAELALNHYLSCDHGCLYCYAPQALHKTREEFLKPAPRKDVLYKLELDARELQRAGEKRSILLSFTGDPYCQLDEKLKLTRGCLDILLTKRLNVTILTKGGRRSLRDFDYFASYYDQVTYAVTLTFARPADSLKWEPCAALPSERIEVLKQAHDLGLKTKASIEPPIDPEQSLELIEKTADFVDFYWIGSWNHDPRADEINWHEFGGRAIELLEGIGKPYYLKEDLRRRMK